MTITKGNQPAEESAAPDASGEAPGAGGPHTPGARDPQISAIMLSGLIALVLGVTAAILPVPYVVESPGPTYNTLGSDGGKPVISVTGHDTYPAKGNLNLTTVYVDGGPNSTVSVFEAFSAWLDGSKAVYPQELIFPEGVTREQSQQESAVAMTTSQENAMASALKELGIPFGQKLEVADLSDGSPSEGKLRPGDVFTSINGKPITSLAVVQKELAAGNGKAVTVVVDRGGKPVTLSVVPQRSETGRFILGVLLKYRFTFPFDVKISLEKVGGPSAGMMFALGIIDTVTPGDLTGGKHIAGTGTITPDGAVGPIGGVAVKMHGARADGATMFLAPAANCPQVTDNVPEGLQVVKVENLKEAKRAVEMAASGADTSELPSCANN